ncbi:uncharacterized protein RJT20DRAFT_125551 [Scheffersomyces xylosifermentans]|uniref:uncharacterized protein n=1 Tax=Scheffersomyces xylosifermentans TaxID=1304137 RepID=UPI00315DF8BE
MFMYYRIGLWLSLLINSLKSVPSQNQSCHSLILQSPSHAKSRVPRLCLYSCRYGLTISRCLRGSLGVKSYHMRFIRNILELVPKRGSSTINLLRGKLGALRYTHT